MNPVSDSTNSSIILEPLSGVKRRSICSPSRITPMPRSLFSQNEIFTGPTPESDIKKRLLLLSPQTISTNTPRSICNSPSHTAFNDFFLGSPSSDFFSRMASATERSLLSPYAPESCSEKSAFLTNQPISPGSNLDISADNSNPTLISIKPVSFKIEFPVFREGETTPTFSEKTPPSTPPRLTSFLKTPLSVEKKDLSERDINIKSKSESYGSLVEINKVEYALKKIGHGDHTHVHLVDKEGQVYHNKLVVKTPYQHFKGIFARLKSQQEQSSRFEKKEGFSFSKILNCPLEEGVLVQEYIEGTLLSDYTEKFTDHQIENFKRIIDVFLDEYKIDKTIDFQRSNFIVSKEGDIVLVDLDEDNGGDHGRLQFIKFMHELFPFSDKTKFDQGIQLLEYLHGKDEEMYHSLFVTDALIYHYLYILFKEAEEEPNKLLELSISNGFLKFLVFKLTCCSSEQLSDYIKGNFADFFKLFSLPSNNQLTALGGFFEGFKNKPL